VVPAANLYEMHKRSPEIGRRRHVHGVLYGDEYGGRKNPGFRYFEHRCKRQAFARIIIQRSDKQPWIVLRLKS
jgi:hypothetical protein